MNNTFEQEYFESNFKFGYDFLVKLNSWRLKKYRKIILNYTQSSHKTLLDIGCAYGHFLNSLKDDFKIFGIDISKYAINIAKKRVNNCKFEQSNIEIEKIPFDENFDIITAMSIIEHLHNPYVSIKQIYDRLNDGGLFCFELPTISNKISKIFYKIFLSHDTTHIFVKNVSEIESLVESIGFRKIAIYSTAFPIFTKMRKIIENFSSIFCIYQK